MPAYRFVERLSVAAFIDTVHEYILRCHKGQFLHEVLFNDLWIHRKPGNDIAVEHENAVRGKECLRDTYAAVCGIVKRAFQPLCAGGKSGV